MELKDQTFLVTGASGGIGRHILRHLIDAGAFLFITGRNQKTLEECRTDITGDQQRIDIITADLTVERDRQVVHECITASARHLDGIINCAGLGYFGLFEDMQPETVENLIRANVIAPILLTRLLIPELRQSSAASIVNVGSTFGSIGFAGFSVYSASKFAMRGFSEALARELGDSEIDVIYVAPRATQTDFNAGALVSMNRDLGVTMDDPDTVAIEIVNAIRQARKQVYIGWPERFFVKLNSLFPSLVDIFLARQLPIIKRFARATA